MAARQTNKRPAGRKTTARKKTSKSKSAGGGVFLGIGLIAVLIALISFSIMSITGSKDKEEPKTVTVIPAQKKETAEKKDQKTEKEKIDDLIAKRDNKPKMSKPGDKKRRA